MTNWRRVIALAMKTKLIKDGLWEKQQASTHCVCFDFKRKLHKLSYPVISKGLCSQGRVIRATRFKSRTFVDAETEYLTEDPTQIFRAVLLPFFVLRANVLMSE